MPHSSPAPPRPQPGWAILICFAASGAAALVYEVCWLRLAGLAFGSTHAALATVLAVFFAGIALGSWGFGRWSQKLRSPLRAYAAIELALAALALASPWAFAAAETGYGAVVAGTDTADDPTWTRMLIVAVLLLPPTVLMGGTFPLFCAKFATARIAGSLGRLYACNTLGAALGCALTGFVLLPVLGTRAAIACGAALSAAAGLGAFWLDRAAALPSDAERDDDDAPAMATDGPSSAAVRVPAWLVGAFAGSGFVTVGLQVVWARHLGLLVHNTVHTTTLTLTTVLTGIVIGSWIATRWFDAVRHPRLWLAGLLLALGAIVQLLLALPPTAWRALRPELCAYALLMLPPMILAGAAFPLGLRLAIPDPRHAGSASGRWTAVNTAGGIIGAVATGFVALPTLGLAGTTWLLTATATVLALWIWWSAPERHQRAAVVAGLALLAIWAGAPAVLGTRVPQDFLAPRDALIAHVEGRTANLAVTRYDGVRQLDIDRWWQGSNERNHQVMAAHVPMLLHPSPEKVLVVGLGTGQAPAAFARWQPERLDVVDIEPALFDFVPRFFHADWMQAEGVRLLRTDGRHYLAHTATRYDVISIEIGQLFRPGAAAFYSAEFYEHAVQRLRPGGILCQFVPLAFLPPEALRALLRTFLDALPHAQLWYNTQELLLLGTRDAPIVLDIAQLRTRLQSPRLGTDLDYAHWGGPAWAVRQPEVFLAGYLCGSPGLARLAPAGTPQLRDDRPLLETIAAGVEQSARMELQSVPLLRAALDPIATVASGASAETLAAATERRSTHLDDLEARAHLRLARLHQRAGALDAAATALDQAIAANADDIAVLRALGDLRGQRDDHAGTAEAYRRALRLDPDDAGSRRGLGLALLQAGAVPEAVEHLRHAVDLRPEDAVAHNYLGAALARTGALQEAVRHVERALELRPGYPSAVTHREHLQRALTGR